MGSKKKTLALISAVGFASAGLLSITTYGALGFRAMMMGKGGSPTQLAFTTTAQTLNGGACSSVVNVQGETSTGNPASFSTSTSVLLQGNDVMFFSDSACTSQLQTLTIGAGTSSANFYLSSQETSSIQATSGTLTAATQAVTINAGAAITGWQFVDGGGLALAGYSLIPSSLTVNQGKIYLGWNAGGGSDTNYVAVYNGNNSSPVWTAVTGSGINYHVGYQCSTGPLTVSLNGKLYATWIENNSSSVGQVRVAVYNGNDASPSWTFVDGDGANGLNYSTSRTVQGLKPVVFNGKFYVVWSETTSSADQMRAKVYNGNDSSPSWSFVDGGAATGINYNTSNSAESPFAVVFNSKLYAFWWENFYVQAKVYNGNDSSPSWTAIAGAGIDDTAGGSGPQDIKAATFNSKLYLSYEDSSTTGNQRRVEVYNGNDGSPSWSFVDGGVGLDYNPTVSGNLEYTSGNNLFAFGNQLFAMWSEPLDCSSTTACEQIGWSSTYGNGGPTVPVNSRLALYNGNDGSPSWAFQDGDYYAGLNANPEYSTSDADDLTVSLGTRLYMAWTEASAATAKVHVATALTATTGTALSVLTYGNSQYDCALSAVRVVDTNGNPAFAPSAQSVSLSVSGGAAYSDPFCTQTIASLSLPAGASAAPFYVMFSGTGTQTVTASSGGLSSGGVTAAITASQFVWTGTAGDGNWATGTNWSGTHAPGTNDTAYFDGTCTNCNATISSAITIAGIHMESTYTGTITQNASVTLTSSFSENGGTYTAASGTLSTSGGNTYLANQLTGGTFNANGATVGVSGQTFTMAGGTFNVGATSTIAWTVTETAGSIDVNSGTATWSGAFTLGGGSLNLASSSTWTGNFTLSGGTFSAGGQTATFKKYTQSSGAFYSGTSGTPSGGAAVTIGNGKTFTLSGGTFYAPNASGSFTLGGSLTISGTPTFYHDSGTLTFDPNGVNIALTPGSTNFNNATFSATNNVYINVIGTLNVGGNLLVENDSTSRFAADQASATVAVSGNVTATSGAYDLPNSSGTYYFTTLEFVGTGTQNINAPVDALPGAIMINSTGTVAITSSSMYTYGWTYTQGGFNAGTSTVYFCNSQGCAPGNFSTGSEQFYNVYFGNSYPVIAGTMYVTNNVTENMTSGAFWYGTIALGGNLTINGTPSNDNGVFDFVGSGTQTITTAAGSVPNFVQIGSGVTLVQHQPGATGGESSTTFGSANTAGNTIVTLVQWEVSGGPTVSLNSVTDSAGNTYTVIPGTYVSSSNGSYAQFATQIAYTTNIAAYTSNSVTPHFSGTAPTYIYTSVYETTPATLDQIATGSSASSTLFFGTSSVTPAQNGEMAFAVTLGGNTNGGGSYFSTSSTGWTMDQNVGGGNASQGTAYLLGAGTGNTSLTALFGLQAGTQVVAAMATFAPTTTAATPTVQLTGNTAFEDSITVLSGTLQTYSGSTGYNLTGSPTITVGAGGSIQTLGSETITASENFYQGATVNYLGTSGPYTSLNFGRTYYNLTINGASTTFQDNGGTLTINGNLNLTAGTLDANNNNIKVYGNVSGSGTLTNSSGTSKTLTLAGVTQSFNEANSIGNLSVTVSSPSAVTLNSGVTTTAGRTFTVSSGASTSLNGNEINVGSAAGTVTVSGTLSCNGGCGTGPITSCDQNSSTGLTCHTLNHTGTISP